MIEITTTRTTLEIKGHRDSRTCAAISVLAQYISLVLDTRKLVKDFKSEYGYLRCEYIESDISRELILNFKKFIRDMNFTGIYLKEE